MIGVIFEVQMQDEKKPEYLAIAESLKKTLVTMPGFISIERFQSLVNPQKILSLSFWEDEQAVANWRAVEEHRTAQSKGRNSIFEDYRLRVVSVIRDYNLDNREQAPPDSNAYHTE